MRLALVTHRATATNLALAAAAPSGVNCLLVAPGDAPDLLGPGDAAIGRLDVRETLDGIEDGSMHLDRLEERGATVLNRSLALLAAHDKLATAGALFGASLPHPRTVPLFEASAKPALPFPFVLKPRFGSWGRDVTLCADEPGYRGALAVFRDRPWFHSAGAVVQELVPPRGHDLRVVVAGGEVVGAIKRVARPGEWRTNVALGARRMPTEPSPAARSLALAAAEAIGADLAGVDLLPLGPGRYAVLEVNGAVDFSPEYASGRDVFATAMEALVRSVARKAPLLPELTDAAAW